MTPKRIALAALAAAALLASGLAGAQAGWVAGEVRMVDADKGRVRLKHQAIRQLDMPAMETTFPVRDRAVLPRLQTGERVRFRAEKIGGQFTVTAIEPQR